MFQSADDDTLLRVDDERVPVGFKNGEQMPFSRKGRAGFFCMGSGYALMSYSRATLAKPLRVCGGGDLLGYGNWHWDDRCQATALGSNAACFFDRDAFESLVHSSPGLVAQLTKLESLVVLQKIERIVALGLDSVKSRVAATLASLDRKFGVADQDGSLISVRVPRATLAGLAGTVVETMSRSLTEMEEDGAIARRGRTIIVRDRVLLEALAFGGAGGGASRHRRHRQSGVPAGRSTDG